MMNKGEERGYSQFLRKANTFEQQIRSQCNCCECGNKFKQERFLQVTRFTSNEQEWRLSSEFAQIFGGLP